MVSIKCSKCGGELKPYDGICPHCGALTTALTAEGTESGTTLPSVGPLGRVEPNGSKRSFMVGTIFGAVTIIVVLIVSLLVIHGMKQVVSVKKTARRGESKQGLHEIQQAVEKYRTDKREYPPYLCGGQARYAETVVQNNMDAPFCNFKDCERGGLSDPLLREGYLESYPPNPFIKNGLSVHRLQSNLTSSMYMGSDPLRNDSEYNNSQIQLGTRFGAECTTMGNMLADPRYRYWTYNRPDMAYQEHRQTCADIEYRFWDLWRGEHPMPFLVGEFFYKSAGPLDAGSAMDAMNEQSFLPIAVDYYMLGAYGNSTDRGQDVIGPEPQIRVDLGRDGSRTIHPWTRSTVNSAGANPEGSPYGAAGKGKSPCYPFTYGNPNGIDDAIILVLTAK